MDGALIPSMREYYHRFGLDAEKLAAAKPDAIVMHPGPMNRGIEISSDVADGARSLILDQVANGLAVRMAVLYLLGGGAGTAVPSSGPSTQTRDEAESKADAPAETLSAAATVGATARSDKS
jgi:hypothetical protein